VHGRDRGAVCDPPGLTPLTGRYLRPGKTWVCWGGANGLIPVLSSTDRTDVHSGTICELMSDLEVDAKLAYYAARTMNILVNLPPPI